MKTILTFAFLITTIGLWAQSPQSFKYQALLRDKNGVLIMDKTVSVRVGILQGSITGTSVYSETHSIKTSTSGTINLEIGKGTLRTGTFTSINWGKNSFFVKIEMDPAGGNAFELVGTSQLLSVPYALYAEKSGDEKWGLPHLPMIFITQRGRLESEQQHQHQAWIYRGPNPLLALEKSKSNLQKVKTRAEWK